VGGERAADGIHAARDGFRRRWMAKRTAGRLGAEMAGRKTLETFNLSAAKLLVVVGHVFEANIYVRMLEGFGAKAIVRCSTVDQALLELQRCDFDLALVDARLADGGAYELVRAMRQSQDPRQMFVPVLMLSGHTPRDQVTLARDCGSHFVIRKPVSASTLLERILWIAHEHRAFIESEAYAGPDRRFKNELHPAAGRREDDPATDQRTLA
jgi:DNA-binding response OmpR family regulator